MESMTFEKNASSSASVLNFIVGTVMSTGTVSLGIISSGMSILIRASLCFIPRRSAFACVLGFLSQNDLCSPSSISYSPKLTADPCITAPSPDNLTSTCFILIHPLKIFLCSYHKCPFIHLFAFGCKDLFFLVLHLYLLGGI